MRIDWITLQSCRGVEYLELMFDPKLTLLVGENGVGKSTILFALRALLQRNFPSLTGGERRIGLVESDDVTIGRKIMPLGLAAVSGPQRGEFLTIFERSTSASRPAVTDIGDPPFVRNTVSETNLVLYFGTRRGVPGPTSDNRPQTDGELGHQDAVKDRWLDHQSLAQWWAAMREQAQESPRAARWFDAVASALHTVMPEFVSWEVKDGRLCAVRRPAAESVRVPLTSLSDGERSLAVLTWDIARRIALLNPFAVDPIAEGEGIVMIDEIDLHLHPKWQRRILGDLMRAFPKIQFIVTTHSPQVIGEVPPAQIRILERNADGQVLARTPTISVGLDSAQVVRLVQHASGRNVRFERELKRIRKLIDEAESDTDLVAAESALDALRAFQLRPDEAWLVDLSLVPEVAGLRAALFRARTLDDIDGEVAQ